MASRYCGRGPEDSLYRSLIAKNGLEDRVRIEPFTNNVNLLCSSRGLCFGIEVGRDAVGIDGGNGTRSTGYCFKSAHCGGVVG